MSTKRTPVRPARKQQFPPEALDMFGSMKELEAKRCRCKPRPENYWGEWPLCRSCEEWHRLNVLLCRPLRLKPWEFPATARPHWKPGRGIDPEIFAGRQRRYRQLEAALEERGKHCGGTSP
jgi:hypothetical protein